MVPCHGVHLCILKKLLDQFIFPGRCCNESKIVSNCRMQGYMMHRASNLNRPAILLTNEDCFTLQITRIHHAQSTHYDRSPILLSKQVCLTSQNARIQTIFILLKLFLCVNFNLLMDCFMAQLITWWFYKRAFL